MPIARARALTGHRRTARADRRLGVVLAFVAGAVNAGGLLAVGRYTSHMTGIVSTVAEDAARGALPVAVAGAVGVLAFTAGAAGCALMVNLAKARRLHSRYAAPLLVEAMLLLGFGLLVDKAPLSAGALAFGTALLCFTMGLQNAVVTKLSNAEIRTTHVTGLVTDIGIELGRALYRRFGRPADEGPTRGRLSVLCALLVAFFAGGVAGALGFHRIGPASVLPLALVLMLLAAVPAIDDLRGFGRTRA
jgi:uncharacterized membrane protein YoaK (UPF0700 family)